MPYINPRVLDFGLNVLDAEATHLHICSSEPSTFAGVAGVSLGNKSGISVGAPADATPTGRKVTIAAITDGSVTATGSATHYAVVDNTNSRLLLARPLSASQSVTSGNTFTTPAFDVTMPGLA